MYKPITFSISSKHCNNTYIFLYTKLLPCIDTYLHPLVVVQCEKDEICCYFCIQMRPNFPSFFPLIYGLCSLLLLFYALVNPCYCLMTGAGRVWYIVYKLGYVKPTLGDLLPSLFRRIWKVSWIHIWFSPK